jgi:hypothetical protein
MSFDPEFIRLVETTEAEDTARRVREAEEATKARCLEVLYDAEWEAERASRQAYEQARQQELLRKGRATLATARTLSALAVERQIPQDIEIGYLVKGSLGRLRRSQRIVQTSGWRIERNIVEPIEEKIPLSRWKGYLNSLPVEEGGPDNTFYPDKYRTIHGYEYGVLLASTGKLYHYHDRGNDDPQSSAPTIVTMPDPSTPIGESRPGGYDRENQTVWDHSKWYNRGGQEAWAYPSEGYDRALARFAISHSLLPQT